VAGNELRRRRKSGSGGSNPRINTDRLQCCALPAANDPAETKETFNRLIAGGFAEEDVWRLLSAVLAVELATTLREGRPFSLDAYVKALKALPDLPLEE
jgi:hypothetical protein